MLGIPAYPSFDCERAIAGRMVVDQYALHDSE